jgi:uncharacterized protein YjbI with pentapeptide repeats
MGWDWLGLRERRWKKEDDEEIQPAKTAWDWLQLLVVPGMLAAIAIGFNASQSAREDHREDERIKADRLGAEDVRHEQNLQRYFDRISDLLLRHGLRDSREYSAVRDVARNVTLATLRSLDGRRKAEVVAFLADAQLIGPGYVAPVDPDRVVRLVGADLREADFRAFERLDDFDLSKADLRGARFDGTRLQSFLMISADLRGASFRRTRILQGGFDDADLRGAHFDAATIGGGSDYGGTFTRTCLSGATFAGTLINSGDFRHAEGRAMDLRSVRFGPDRAVLVDVGGADLTGRGGRTWTVQRKRSARASRPPCSSTVGTRRVTP